MLKIMSVKSKKPLKDKSGVDKIIVKTQPYRLMNTNSEFFPSLMPPTLINWLMNFRKLGQISSPLVLVCEVAIRRLAM